jgi:uroporphyrin-III C-methyltransferase/precorrin-2 dehydrogenase/sirohydrochlorin ferrochelatase
MRRNKATSGTGSVVLVGAGPGDPELLTLKAVRMLQSADVVLFDALVSDGVLDLVRREARCLAVGKRGGRASCRQQDINDLMVRFARRGKRVVRLKAGDPMIFGRAGEEIAQLEAAGIPVEIVPGITAGLAAAAALGVSLTHRDHAHSVRFVTGHSKDGGLPEGLDWRGLADRETSLVFYMAGRTGSAAARRLIAEGLPPATPVVAMASVSRPDEERWAGTLATLAADGCPFGADKPVLLGIGRVFAKAVRAAGRDEGDAARIRTA